jgi:hypothetical protein
MVYGVQDSAAGMKSVERGLEGVHLSDCMTWASAAARTTYSSFQTCVILDSAYFMAFSQRGRWDGCIGDVCHQPPIYKSMVMCFYRTCHLTSWLEKIVGEHEDRLET